MHYTTPVPNRRKNKVLYGQAHEVSRIANDWMKDGAWEVVPEATRLVEHTSAGSHQVMMVLVLREK